MRRPAALVFTLLLASACSSDSTPPDNTFDGNVVVGDAAFPRPDRRDTGDQDAGEEDARSTDAGLGTDGGATDDSGLDTDGGAPDDSGQHADASVSPCTIPGTVSVTATGAVARIRILDGTRIEVVATATIGASTCTGECTAADPCCQSCTAPVLLDGIIELLDSPCEAPGCQGTNCRLTCFPFTFGLPERFTGILRARPNDSPALELFRVDP